MSPVFRAGTDDEAFWHACFTNDEYNCPQFNAADTVIDLGASIGAFTAKAHERGSRNIWSYEACPDNMVLARQNTDFDGVRLFHKAVMGTFRPESMPFPVGNNSFFIPEHAPQNVETTTLDKIIEEIGGPVRYLKIDIEGSEWEVLYTSKLLSEVQEISGEYHQPCLTWYKLKHIEGLPEYTHLALKAFLEDQGFAVDIPEPTKGAVVSNGFHAVRQ